MTEIVSIQFRSDADTADRDIRELTAAMRRLGAETKRTSTSTKSQTTSERQRARAIDSSSRATERARRSTRSYSLGNLDLSKSLKSAAKSAGLAAAGYIGIAQAKQAVGATTDLAKATLSLHKNLGLSVKTASEFSAVAKVRDVDTRSLTMATKTLSTQIEAAKAGTEDSVRAFTDLGISMKQLRTESPDRLLFDIADGARKLGDGTARTATLAKLLGRSFAGLSPVLREGSGAMRENLKAADEMGASFRGKNLQSIKDIIVQERRAKLATLGLQIAFTEELQPSLIAGLRAFGDITGAIRKLPQPIKNLMNPIGAVIGAFDDLKGLIDDVIDVLNVIPGVDIGHVGGGDGPSGTKKKKKQGGGGGGGGGYAVGGKVNRPTYMVGEEGPAHPEYVIATNPAYRSRNLGLWAQAGHEIGVPGFAFGGIPDNLPGLPSIPSPSDLIGKLPGTGGLPDWLKGAGDYAISAAKKYIAAQLSSVFSGGLPSAGGVASRALVPIGHELQRRGFQVSGHPAFPPIGRHTPGSFHYLGRAIDVNHDQGNELGFLSSLYNTLAPAHPTELFYRNRGIPNPVPDHYDHLHMALAEGGVIRGFTTAVRRNHANKTATLALFEAGLAESGMRDLSYGDASSTGALQLLASTAASMSINPHNEVAIADAFLTRGYWGRGSAKGLAHGNRSAAEIAHLVQGNATGSGVYAAQASEALRLMGQAGLRFSPGGKLLPEHTPKVKRPAAKKKPKKKHGVGGSITDASADTALPDLLAEQWAVVAENARRGRAAAPVFASMHSGIPLGAYQSGPATLTSPSPGGDSPSVGPPTINIWGASVEEQMVIQMSTGKAGKVYTKKLGRNSRRRAVGPGR